MDTPDWLKPLYPFESHTWTTAGGARLHYIDEGPRNADEAVLMLHGNPTWSFYYRRLISAIAPRTRCIAPDHIGMGLSDKLPDYPYTLQTRIDDIEGLVNALGLRKVHLVVHDWGGAVGFGLAARDPKRIGSIVILNTAAFPSPHIPRRIAFCRAPVIGPLLVRGANGFAWPATWMSMHRRRLTQQEKRGYLFPYGTWADRVAVNAFVQDIPMTPTHPTWATLERIAQAISALSDNRVLIVWGGKDFCFHKWFYEEWRRRLPKAETHYLEDAGHYVLEDAEQQVIPLIQKFLADGLGVSNPSDVR